MIERRAMLGGTAVAAAMIHAAAPTAAHADEPAIWSAEYTAMKGDVKLAMYRKRVGPPDGKPRPVMFFVHGSTLSARPTYDLTIPGRDDLSMMNVAARWGYDVWTMDHEGYGKSTVTSGNSDIASGVEDLKAGAAVVLRETGQQRMSMMGESSGALRVGGYAMAQPDRVNRLVLQAFTYTGADSGTLSKRAEQTEYFKTHNRRPREASGIVSIFNRDRPDTTDQDVIDAVVKAEMVFGNSVPSGTYLDMTVNLPVVQPAKVLAPVLLISGQYDGIASLDDICNFFKLLPNGDKQITIIPGAAHTLVSSKQRFAFWRVMKAWLEG